MHRILDEAVTALWWHWKGIVGVLEVSVRRPKDPWNGLRVGIAVKIY